MHIASITCTLKVSFCSVSHKEKNVAVHCTESNERYFFLCDLCEEKNLTYLQLLQVSLLIAWRRRLLLLMQKNIKYLPSIYLSSAICPTHRVLVNFSQVLFDVIELISEKILAPPHKLRRSLLLWTQHDCFIRLLHTPSSKKALFQSAKLRNIAWNTGI